MVVVAVVNSFSKFKSFSSIDGTVIDRAVVAIESNGDDDDDDDKDVDVAPAA